MGDAPKSSRPLFEKTAGVRTFGRLLMAGLVLFIVVVFAAVYVMQVNAIRDSVHSQAESYIDLIQHARKWNAMHGGVWVEKGLDSKSNEYLRKLGMDPDMETKEGVLLTLRNPAMMTREIAELTGMEGDAVFRISSLEPCNPTRDPDAWETSVLTTWKRSGDKPQPVAALAAFNEQRYYRYMVPLYVDEACLKCHADYTAGDLRGGLEVAIRYAPYRRAIRDSGFALGGLMLLTLGVMTTSMTLILRQLRDRLKEASTELERMAVTDELTGMLNRRAALVRLDEEVSRARRSHAPLSVILIDLDHFKNVNDEFGHAVGDHVLQSVSGRLRKVEREYDVLARYGGEEFLIIAPDTDRDGAVILGERARGQFAEHAVSFPGGSVSVTLSAGVASLLPADSADGLLGRADAALYESKRKGRDCVSPAD